jgi:7-cyano-7-deazaguanine tRNA-ribosyltransferase
MYIGPESMSRPEIIRFRRRLKKNYQKPATQTVVCFTEPGDREESFEEHYRDAIESIQKISDAHFVFQTAFGPVPIEFNSVYPFGQAVLEPMLAHDLSNRTKVTARMEEYSHDIKSGFTIIWSGEETLENLKMLAAAKNTFDLDAAKVAAIADYQFGPGAANALFNGTLKFIKSKNTGKIRNVHCDNEHVLSLRAEDGLFTLKPAGAIKLHSAFKPSRMRVVVESESAEFNREGKNVFSKFVVKTDPELRPGDEVLVTDEQDNLAAIGRLKLTSHEIEAFDTGIAVRIREGFKHGDQH